MKLKQLELLSQDLKKIENFYSQILGLEIINRSDLEISFKSGSSILKFIKTEIKDPVYHFAFNIPNNKLEEAEKWLSSRVSLVKYKEKHVIDFENWNAKSLYFLDSTGNVLEFIARFDLENTSNKPFGSEGIIEISEIAFVTESVKEMADKLMNDNGLSYYSKQIPIEDFCAIGNDNGLLILSGVERNWFPTTIKAKHFSLKVIIENSIKIISLQH